ncbi:MAG: hypothetical protein COA74_12925 [Gammaproteobacteria bacterium]|nr:MAG: hypothetical protein COA74_12925 [Gammaproteobacteria bacterium]
MSQEAYRIILKGYKAGKGEYYIEESFATLFKITQKEARDYFKETPKTLKENLTLEQAEQYEADIKSAGADCEVEDMRFNLSGLSLE